MTISSLINDLFDDLGSLWDRGTTRTPSKYEGMELADTWQWIESRRDVSPELTEKVLAGLDKPWSFVGPGSSGSGLLPTPAPIAGSEEFYESLGRANASTEVPEDALKRMHSRDRWYDWQAKDTDKTNKDEGKGEEEEPEEYDEPVSPSDDRTYNEYDQRVYEENTYVTEEGDVHHTYHTYQYDPNAAQDIEKASQDGLFGSSGLFGMMMLMMIMMPMMQGFGGMQQVVRAEPAQGDVSGLFY